MQSGPRWLFDQIRPIAERMINHGDRPPVKWLSVQVTIDGVEAIAVSERQNGLGGEEICAMGKQVSHHNRGDWIAVSETQPLSRNSQQTTVFRHVFRVAVKGWRRAY